MTVAPSTVIAVDADPSAVGAARRAAAALGRRAGLDEPTAGRLALVVTELATNLVHHAGGGELVLRALLPWEGLGLEVLSLDRGPGMRDVAACLRDGYSTGGTRGAGLGAVSRAASLFEIVSAPGAGTAILARVGALAAAPPLALGAVCLPMRGESACGDGWCVRLLGARARVLAVDGIGHGPQAADAARAALAVLGDADQAPAEEVLLRCDAALRGTRGAVLALLELDGARRELTFAGVGNVAAVVIAPGARHGLPSQHGVVGHRMPAVRVVREPLAAGAILVLHSDGLGTRWDLDATPGLVARHPALVAGVLYRDFARGRDDVTALVVA